MATAFVALDFINDIVDPAGRIAGSAAEVAARGTLATARDALAVARDRGWLPVLVRVGFAEGYAAAPKHSPIFGHAVERQALILGTWGTEFHPTLGVQPSDSVILKPRVSAFYDSGLEALLRANHVQRLVICGVSTAWAVQATVRDGHDRDYEMMVVEDACAAADGEEHAVSLHLLSRIARIVRADDLAGL